MIKKVPAKKAPVKKATATTPNKPATSGSGMDDDLFADPSAPATTPKKKVVKKVVKKKVVKKKADPVDSIFD